MIRKLTEAECIFAVENGDFDPALFSGPAAIILTQSWCPQWKAMQSYLPNANAELSTALNLPMEEIKIYYVEYDIETWEVLKNEDFMSFKEKTFDNREIPYVRYYLNGAYSRDSNFISLDGFKSRFGAD